MLFSVNTFAAALLACSTLVAARPAVVSSPHLSSSSISSPSISIPSTSVPTSLPTTAHSGTCKTVMVTSTITKSTATAPATTSLATLPAYSVKAPTITYTSVFEVTSLKVMPDFVTTQLVAECMFHPGQCTTVKTGVAGYHTFTVVNTMTRYSNNALTLTLDHSVPTAMVTSAAPSVFTTVVPTTICS